MHAEAHINPNCNAGLAELSPDGNLRGHTEAFSALVGYSDDQLREMPHDQLLAPGQLERVNAVHQLVRDGFGPVTIETIYLRSDGSQVPVEMEAGLSSDGLALQLTNLRLREAHARAMRETAENYRLLLQSATEHAIIRLDESGSVISWNPGAERILGYKEEEILGRSASLFFTTEDIATGVMERELDAARRLGRGEDDRWQVRRDRTRFWASGITTPFRNEAGEIEGFVKIFCDLTDKKIIAERSLYLAQHDSLTGLPNRKSFHDELDELLAEAKNNGTEVAVMFIDLDRFKTVNDSLGHHAGDQLLKCVAQRLQESVRKTDVIARLSGDEFGIICTQLRSHREAEHLADKLVRTLTRPFQLGKDRVSTGGSIGVTVFPKDSCDADQLLINADLAMYRAKNQGRAKYVLYTEQLNDEAARRHALDEASRLALQRNEFELHYQPQFALGTDRICGLEALLRWKNPGLPMVTTAEFVAQADDTGLIVPLGEWVLRTACVQLKAWHDQGFSGLRVAVNMSYRQIKEAGFLKMLDRVFAESGVDPSAIELEITEGLLMQNTSMNTSLLHSMKERGLRLSVDDFGTGFSSLSYLKHFPVDSLKIDQTFIKHLPDNRNDASITSAIIGLGHSMNLTVVAEGIETEEQADFLKERNCDCAQGFYFAKALPPEQIGALLSSGRHGRWSEAAAPAS